MGEDDDGRRFVHSREIVLQTLALLRTTLARAMDQINPIYIPRNHKTEEALAAATNGDLEPFHELLQVVTRPFDERPGCEAYALPAPPAFAPYRTFCGT